MKTRLFLLLLLALILSSCASPRMASIPDTMTMKNLVTDHGVEKKVEHPVAPDSFAGLDGRQTYTLTVQNAELRDTLLLLSRKTGLAIIVDNEVTGRVTADLQDKTVREILSSLLKPYGYTVYTENGVIQVSKPRLITRTFYLNYLKDKRTSTSTMNATSSDSTNQGTVTSSASPVGSTTSVSSSQSQGVTISTSGVTDFWNEIIKGLEVIVFGDSTGSKRSEGGYSKADKSGKQLVVNELAGIVYIKDYSDNMENVKTFLDDVDQSLKRQVLIQAHIAEVTLSDTFSFGINWSNILNSGLGNDLLPLTLSQNLAINPTQAFQVAISNSKVNALLDAMKEQGTLNMLSSPKVSTLNNQKAVIKLTKKEVSWYQKTTIVPGSNGNSTIKDNIPQINEVGIYLDVTPQIDERGNITMQIHPNISEVSTQSLSPDGTSSMPVIDIREVDTMIGVKNNETIVIAGLIVDKISEIRRGVPFLGDIPYLGNLFSYIKHQKQKTELVILITPYLLNEKTITSIRAEHEERIKNAERKFTAVP